MAHPAYNEHDRKAIRILDDFLPHKIFDAHAHFRYDEPEGKKEITAMGMDVYYRDMTPLFGEKRKLVLNSIPYPYMSLARKDEDVNQRAVDFLVQDLTKYPECAGELMVFPEDTPEEIEARLIHPGITGLKCYYFYAKVENRAQADVGDYLPDSAWEVAQKHKLAITLHLMKDEALFDEKNRSYIKTMAKRYPDATLILAHSARSFAAWTGLETVAELAPYENIWFDFAAICESPSIFQILNKIGTERSMWGSDYDISMLRGKPISLADGFHWIGAEDLAHFDPDGDIHSWLIGTENLMAMRQAAIMAELKEDALEDVFYNNAQRLLGRK